MNVKLILVLFTVSFLFTYSSCSKGDDTPETVSENIVFNVAYASANGAQKMDMYLPANRNTASTKSLIVIHGGAWVVGDKTEMNEIVDSLRKRLPGYAVFNLNYRLSQAGQNLFPVPNNDVHEAITYILSKKDEYKISDKLAILGVSAGGQLGLLEAYTNNTSGKIKAVIAAFPPTDLTDMWNNPAGTANNTRLVLQNYMGSPQGTNPVGYATASPINAATAQSVPTQLFHGTADTVVRYQQSVSLRNKLQTLSVPVQYTEYPGANHGWGQPQISDTYAKIQAFLQQYVQ